MLRDTPRDEICRKGIEQCAAGLKVLDIGTGSGLLAMMAARAGAKHVYACETNGVLASAAKKVIAANGLTDRITVFSKSSIELDPDTDLNGPVDLVVSELIADDMLSEALLPSLNDASRRLIKDDGIFLPGKTWVKLALVNYEALPQFTSHIEGFDLSACAQLLPRRISVRANRRGLNVQSSSAELFPFDYRPGLIHRVVDSETVEVTARRGRANAIAQWVGFECGEGNQYENGPGGPANLHWRIQLTPIEPIDLDEGQTIAIEAHRDRLGMILHPLLSRDI